ncbi:MAG: hypothetical protein N2322_07310 [Terrimicrobiaceae bacterium]|nr:hypothetical protein [Terrimicrobiaceae bacterium]
MSLNPGAPLAPFRPSPFPWRVLALAGGLLALWAGFLAVTGWRADLAESNLQANLSRISRYLSTPEPENVLVGSSVAGRLLPEYFREHGVEVLNLGLDGSRPLFVFEILEKHERLPRRVLLETSGLFLPLGANDEILRQAVASPTMGMSRVFFPFRPENRPVSVLYERLKSLREFLTEGRSQPALPPPSAAVSSNPELPATYPEIRNHVRKLKEAGTEVVLVDIPRGAGWAGGAGHAAKHLARELGLRLLEAGPAIYESSGEVLRFSDGLHLDAPSARRVASWLVEAGAFESR